MSEKVKTEQFTARIKEADKQFIVSKLKEFPTQHEGMSALLSKLNQAPDENIIKELVEANELNAKLLAEISAHEENIKNLESELSELKTTPAPEGFLIKFSPELSNKLTALRRVLKQKEKIPQDCSELEFLQEFINYSLTNLINEKYSYINRS